MFNKFLCIAITAFALCFSPGMESTYAGGSGKDLTFEFKVQVSPRNRVAPKKWKTVASYKKKAVAERKAQKVQRNHRRLHVRVKQKK